MQADPWTAFDRLVMGGSVRLKSREVKELGERLSEEKLLCMPGFVPVAAQLAAGNIDKFSVGDKITTVSDLGDELDWIIIGRNQDGDNTLTVQTEKALGRVRFCKPTTNHPYGWNHPLHNDMTGFLHIKFAERLCKQDIDCLTHVQKKTRTSNTDGGEFLTTTDMFFCLSASEAGFEVDDEYVYEEGAPYEFYDSGDSERRVRIDQDGNFRYWWLRSPFVHHDYTVRIVDTDGDLDFHDAYDTFAVAPACVIRAKPIS